MIGNKKLMQDLSSKMVNTLRVWTSDGYVQVDFTEEQATDLLMSLKCLQEL